MSDTKPYIHLLILCLVLAMNITVSGQTPGLIIKPSSSIDGRKILDPDGDGYVSQKTNGIQKGFTIPPDNDVLQSEIPYVALVRPDVQGDLERGPTGGFTEIVGTDAAGNNAILTYTDGINLYYRFRLSGYAPNSKSYSILIDTDGKFGFTGLNKDDDAIVGNPGFEVEIVLETNFNVYAYNVNGSATRPATAAASALYDTNCQKSIAVSTAGSDIDYFYDFYLPYPTSLFTKDTPLRYVALTSMNPFPAIGNNAVSDVGGVGSFTNLDQAFTDLITAQTPTLPGQEVLDRTACPSISAVGVTDASITGTTVSGATVNVYVYQSNGTTLVGSGTATTTGTTWTINKTNIKDALNNSISLQTGYKIKATATAAGFGVSFDNCDIETVNAFSCSVKSNLNSITTVNPPKSGKGFVITTTAPANSVFTLYNSDFSQASITGVTNPITITTAGQTVNFTCQQGNCFTDGAYYITVRSPNECESNFMSACIGLTASTTPTITTNPITVLTTSITGAGSTANAQILIYADGVQITSATTSATAPYGWTANVTGLQACNVITAKQVSSGMCFSPATNGITVSRAALKPVISFSGCSASSPVTSISGTSSEADGTVITLYTPNSLGTSLGTATVTGGVWTKTGLSLTSGTIIVAKVTSGSCLTESAESVPVTISTQTNISSYPITFNSVTEKQVAVSGTISGISSPVTLNLYVDKTYVGSTTINSNGIWSVSGINSYDLYVGGKVQATITSTGCESALSANFTTIQCLPPSMPAYTGGSKSYCMGGTGQVALTSSETEVIYQLVNSLGVAQGPAVVGTGGGITLFTNALNSNLTGVYVKAYKIGTNACAIISTTAINFDSVNPSPSVTFTSTNLSVTRGTTSLSFPYTAKSLADLYTIDYSLAANNQGFTDIKTQTAISSSPINLTVPAAAAIGTYSGTITIYSNAGLCTASYDFIISVYQAGSPPVISGQPVNNTICAGQTTSLSVSAIGTVTGYQWQSSTSYSGPYTNIAAATSASYTTSALATTTYYKVIVSNANGSVTSSVATVTVTSAAGAAGAIAGNASVCAGQNGVNYSVSPIANATSYTWTYSGTGAFINGTGSSVYINFGNNATSGTLSVAGSNSCGSGTASNYVVTVNPLPIVTAGINQSTCSNAGAVVITSGASASNYSTLAWTSSGTGTIANNDPLSTATYTPSPGDIADGSVTLTLTATGNGSCATATVPSTKILTIAVAPVATAGGSISTCSGMAAIPMTGASASGTYTGTPVWSGDAGAGTWVQNADPAQATFTPSTASGSFTATLTLNGCSIATSTRTISWGTSPTPSFTVAPAPKSCVGSDVTYTTEDGQNNYVWSIPGTVNSDYSIVAGRTDSNSVTIKWLKTGNQTVTVNYKNASGCPGAAAASNSTTVYAIPAPSEIIIN